MKFSCLNFIKTRKITQNLLNKFNILKEQVWLTKFALFFLIILYRWESVSICKNRHYVKLRPRFGDVLGRGFT